MRFVDPLPQPSPEALQHSQQLIDRMQEAILQAGGKISFYQYMQMALYEPGLGYYVAGLKKFGQYGDFVTAPEISSLFSYSLANQCAQVLQHNPSGIILELGAGSGRMAADLLTRLQALDCLPATYWILELSPDLRQTQYETLNALHPEFIHRIQWLEQLPQQAFTGVILANEVLDAMPVELFSLRNGQRITRHVLWQQNQLAFEKPASDYISEYNPALAAWLRSLADCLEQGLVLLLDYGYEQADYYHPERHQGTLICHYQHRVHDNPLLYPGLQDITASVDFTALAEAGVNAGLTLSGYSTQANFLISCGLEDLFQTALQQQPQQHYAFAQQVRTLCMPSEMGERFKVMAFTKAFTQPLDGFRLPSRIQYL